MIKYKKTLTYFTDDEFALALIKSHNGNLIYCKDTDNWFCYNGRFWQFLSQTQMHDKVINMKTEAMEEFSGASSELGQIAKIGNNSRRKAIIQSCKLIEGDHIVMSSDLNPSNLISFQNGTFDLNTGVFHKHRKEDNITNIMNFAYDSNAPDDVIVRFLNTTFCDNVAVIEYVMRFLSTCLTNDISARKCMYWFGEGANGKSTLQNLVRSLLQDLVTNMNTDYFIDSKSDRTDLIEREKYKIIGKSLVFVNEVPSDKKFNHSLVKTLVGENITTAKKIYGDPVDINIGCKLIFTGNYIAANKFNDTALDDRMVYVPFNNRIAEKDRDPHLIDKLIDQLPGFFNLLYDAYQRYLLDGLGDIPDALTKEAADSSSSSLESEFTNFFSSAYQKGTGSIKLTDIVAQFNHQNSGSYIVNSKSAKEILQSKGCEFGLSDGSNHLRGYTTKDEVA